MKLSNEQLKKIPLKPGVYMFVSGSTSSPYKEDGEILYVGRATSLRRRVGQYFVGANRGEYQGEEVRKKKSPPSPFIKGEEFGGGNTRLDPRIREMVGLAKEVKYIETDTLLEAIILEANLIKKYWPKYNVKDKDDRSFIYIVIPKKRRQTQIRAQIGADKKSPLPLPTGQAGPFIKGEEYDYPRPIIVRGQELSRFINIGTSDLRGAGTIFGRSDVLDAHVFGPYQSLTIIKNALKIIRRIFPYSTCKPFLIEGKNPPNPPETSSGQALLEKGKKITPPNLPLSRGGISPKPCFNYQIGLCPGICVGVISKEDYQKNIDDIILLLKGEKKKLIKKLQKENPDKVKELQHIQDVSLIQNELGIRNYELGKREKEQWRIEGYDISHLAGKETYGSMVVFENNKPNKDEYRLFKIKSAPASDDLKSLEEVIRRRFKHLEWRFPDIILIDGGRPQIGHINKILKEININIPLLGISKYEKRKKSPLPSRNESGASSFRKGGEGDTLVFPSHIKKSFRELAGNIKNVLLQVRDESHRFALKASRRKRGKMETVNRK